MYLTPVNAKGSHENASRPKNLFFCEKEKGVMVEVKR